MPEAGGSCTSIVQGGRKRRGDGMGESRDAVKAASEIGRDHDGKVCPEQAIDISVIAVTFRGATPRVAIEGGCAIGSPQFLGATANSRRPADLPTFPARGRVVLPPDRRLYVCVKPFAVSQIRRRPAGRSIL